MLALGASNNNASKEGEGFALWLHTQIEFASFLSRFLSIEMLKVNCLDHVGLISHQAALPLRETLHPASLAACGPLTQA